MEKNEYEHVTVDKLDIHDESISGIRMRDIDEVHKSAPSIHLMEKAYVI